MYARLYAYQHPHVEVRRQLAPLFISKYDLLFITFLINLLNDFLGLFILIYFTSITGVPGAHGG